MLYEERCQNHLRCTANICILDPDIELRNYIPEDGFCKFILNYLEGKDTQFDNEIKQTEKIWRKKIPESALQKRLKNRKQVREYFQKGENKKVCTRDSLHVQQQAI